MQYSRALAVVCLAAAIGVAAACARVREYELRGQILTVDTARRELTIKHEDIKGFMPGMTMPFKVDDARSLAQRKPGELIRATLVIEDDTGYLKDITSLGQAALTEPPPPPRVDVLAPGDQVPDNTLLDVDGRAHTLAEWRGKLLAVTFIYTRCPVPDFCPLMDRRFGEVQRLVAGDAALRGRVRLLSVTFDPEHDTPTVLAAHARKAGADPEVWSFLTGERAELTAFSARFGVTLLPDTTHPLEIVHNLRTAVVDDRGRVIRILNGNEWTAENVIDAWRK
jgi:protein SCO1/2